MSQFNWTPEALQRMKKIPFFVRGLAKRRIEASAREQNINIIDIKFIDEVKRKEMPNAS